ncbi:MAG: hypothetical protein IPP71_21465 [Bacteroidetes bacterium]|nr:hypothetical protein [Bacteroidota bacterium]
MNSFILTEPVICNKEFFIGFEGYDLAGAEENFLGIRAYTVTFNDSIVFQCRIDSFSFDETRFVNAHIDYEYLKQSKRKITYCYRLGGNQLPFYSTGTGLMTLKNKQTGRVVLEVEDTKGNKTKIKFEVIRGDRRNENGTKLKGKIVLYDQESVIAGEFIKYQLGKVFLRKCKTSG